MANRTSRVHKLSKHYIKQHARTDNLLTLPVSIWFCHNTDDKCIDMELNAPSTNNTSSTTTADVQEKPADTIGKEHPNSSKNDQN